MGQRWWVYRIVWTCAILCGLRAEVVVDESLELPYFVYDGDSHFDFGRALGDHFKERIQTRVQQNTKLQTVLLPFSATKLGRDIYEQYLSTHNQTFPVGTSLLYIVADKKLVELHRRNRRHG
jgi:hypothetical protein